ncbi:MAG: ABC transporter permease [Candidatus Sericytochromatia bacterium]|nr:ABC transporter permease [Candidatus Tanganyikabacteria bacterium]
MAIGHLARSALTLPAIGRHRELIGMMVRRDLAQRYRATLMGLLWSLLHPLLTLLLYTYVFSVVLKVKFGADASTASFALYLFCGMLPWLAFSEGLNRSAGVVVENVNLVKKVIFPLEILPLNLALAAVVTQAVGMAILLPAIMLRGITPTWLWLLVPLLILPQLLWTVGLGWWVSSLGVYVRDVGQAIGLVLMAWMFLTPIYYPESMIPAEYRWLGLLNPMAVLIGAHRDLLLDGRLPAIWPLLGQTAAGAFVFLLGFAWFAKTKKGFADVI